MSKHYIRWYQFYTVLFLFLAADQATSLAAAAAVAHPAPADAQRDLLSRAAEATGRLIGEAAQGVGQMFENQVRNAQYRVEEAEIEALQNPDNPLAQARLADARQVLAQARTTRTEMQRNLANGGMQIIQDKVRTDAEVKGRTDVAAVTASIEGKASIKRLEQTLNFMKDPENLKPIVLYTALGVVLCTGGYYGCKFGYRYFEANLGKPRLVRESSRNDLRTAIKDYWYHSVCGYKRKEADLNSLVFTPDIDFMVKTLADDIKNCHEFGLPYQNVLFYGPPGTGKTEFAKLLAKYSDMDYAILSGADFSQFKKGEGITEIHKLFEWAKASKRGLVIFIDEADACFRDRATLNKEAIDIVNTFLSHTGDSSKEYVLVLATNYENELDGAIRSRLHKKIPFMLPGADERAKILNLKIDKYIINDVRVYHKDGKKITAKLTIDPAITSDYLQSIVAKTDGFSGRDLDQLVAEVRLRAYRSGKNVVTKEICDYVVANKVAEVKKDQETTRKQHARLARQADGAVRNEVAAAA